MSPSSLKKFHVFKLSKMRLIQMMNNRSFCIFRSPISIFSGLLLISQQISHGHNFSILPLRFFSFFLLFGCVVVFWQHFLTASLHENSVWSCKSHASVYLCQFLYCAWNTRQVSNLPLSEKKRRHKTSTLCQGISHLVPHTHRNFYQK